MGREERKKTKRENGRPEFRGEKGRKVSRRKREKKRENGKGKGERERRKERNGE